MATVEELPVEQQFLNDYKYSVEVQEQKSKRKPSKTYKPSSLQCLRNMYFQVVGADLSGDRASSELIGISQSGTDRHERIQQDIINMRNNGVDCDYVDVGEYIEAHRDTLPDPDIQIVSKVGNETKLRSPKFNISFLCDGIIRYKGIYYIVEIKTETGNKFWDRKGVDEGHELQGTAYSFLLNIDSVLFLYECRDTCNKKTYLFTPAEQSKIDLLNKINACDGYVSRCVAPPKPVDIPKKYCTYCNYSELCKKVG
jgi:hypothetical protein